jgi:cytochrome c biogenesis protein CcdA
VPALTPRSALLILWAALAACVSGHAAERRAEKLTVRFYGSRTCGECLEIKESLLKPLAQKHPDSIELRLYDIEDTAAFGALVKREKAYGVTAPSPQELFLPDTVLLGYEQIMAHGRAVIVERLNDPSRWAERPLEGDTTGHAATLKERFQQFTFWGIVAAGLVDGINPCAIATMIFLISFLATQKRSRREVLMVGLAFTAAVYATYFLLGVGAFGLLTTLGIYVWLSRAIKWTAVVVAAVFALYSFRDAFVYARTGKAQDIKLQLPKALKLQIHKVISGNLGSGSLVIGSVVTGFLVTLLEAVCTGQVYLPTIVLMTNQEGLRLQGWLYLAFYNLLFVLPLLGIMVLAYYGLTWSDLSKATQKYMVTLKVLLGVVLAGLAVFLGVAG